MEHVCIGTAATEGHHGAAPTAAQRVHYEENGYVVVDDAVPPAMLPELLAASRALVAAARNGTLDTAHAYVHRTRGAEGDPWCLRGAEPWRRSTASQSSQLTWRLPRPFNAHATGWLRCAAVGQLELPALSIFTNPVSPDFVGVGGWHRDVRFWESTHGDRSLMVSKAGKESDTEKDDYSEAAQRHCWAKIQDERKHDRGAKWQLALLEDACLELVPRSHREFRTPYEDSVLTPGSEHFRADAMPTGIAVQLRPGQAVVYDGRAIHRGGGHYRTDVERMTLSASFSMPERDEELGEGSMVGTATRPVQVDDRRRWQLRPEVGILIIRTSVLTRTSPF